MHRHIFSDKENLKFSIPFEASGLLFNLKKVVSPSSRIRILLNLLPLETWVYTGALVSLEYTEFGFLSDEECLKKITLRKWKEPKWPLSPRLHSSALKAIYSPRIWDFKNSTTSVSGTDI